MKRKARTNLKEIGQRHGSDKFTRHSYEDVYERFMESRRDEALKILEIGIGGENIESGGGSLLTWRDYLPNALVFGIDIYEKTFLDGDRVQTFVCSQTDLERLNQLCEMYGPFDMIIDDGSHKGPDVSIALFTLFPQLTPGGLYFIEDMQTSYWAHYCGSSLALNCYDTAARWVKLSVDLINRGEVLDPYMFPLAANIDVSELHVFHNIAVLMRRPSELSLKSRILTEEMRQNFLDHDRTMHGAIAKLHTELCEDPAKFRSLLEKVEQLGGLDKFLYT